MPKAKQFPPPPSAGDLEDLRRSGLTEATIRAAGLHTEDDAAKLAAILKHSGKPPFIAAGALVFPYHDLDGNRNCFARVRPHKARVVGGKAAKYEQPKGSSPRAYYPPAVLEKLRDAALPLFITEGEKKALALAQLGLAAVGVGGVWCGCKKGKEELIDDLAALPLDGRDVFIVFDHDAKPATRQEADAARLRLAKALKAAGAGEVHDVQLPPGPDGSKQGVDDFLTAHGEDAEDAFGSLVDRANPVIKIIPAAVAGGGNPVIKIISPALGEAAYHGPVGEFIRAVGPYTEATDAGILAHLLPALGVYVGPGPHVHDGSGNKQPARVNTVLVGPTSTGRKGTALAPVDRAMSLLDEAFWKEQRVGGLSTGEGLISKVADKNTESETVLVEKRLYVVEEEFSKVLAQLRRDGNILSQILRESFDSGNLSVMTRNNPLQAFGAHVGVTGHITPEELLDRFNHVEMANGFGNRFLWFAVKSDKVLPRCQPIPEEIFNTFSRRRVQHLHDLAAVKSLQVPLADASQREWEKVIYPALREDQPGMAGHLLARGSAIVLRLSLLYSLLDPPPKGGSRVILPAHLHAATAVWDYCQASVWMVFGARSGTFLGDKILELLAAGPMTKDALNDHLSPHQKAEAGGVLADLEAAGLVRKTTRKPEKAGRPATVWQIAG